MKMESSQRVPGGPMESQRLSSGSTLMAEGQRNRVPSGTKEQGIVPGTAEPESRGLTGGKKVSVGTTGCTKHSSVLGEKKSNRVEKALEVGLS
uniref:Uncharacterized protein n=1 Tax=Steinernema glaseri TaxID=37863 RepID=A0A1I7Y8V5_9BILA